MCIFDNARMTSACRHRGGASGLRVRGSTIWHCVRAPRERLFVRPFRRAHARWVPRIAMNLIHASGRHLRSCLLLLSLVVLASCSNGEQRHAQSPTSPSIAADNAATGDTAGTASTSSADSGIINRSTPGSPWLKDGRNSSEAVDFPRRDETFQFRQQLEVTYRDGLRRPATTGFVDVEGAIVWTAEYLRYRVNGCTHQDAITRVTAQIQGRGVQPVCARTSPAPTVNFPPRNEPFAFRQELERIYRDELRRSAGAIVRRRRRRHRLDAGISALSPQRVLASPTRAIGRCHR